MILFWKLNNIAHTDHIWFTTPNIVNGTILSHMWKFLILFIPLSTWTRREAIDCVSTTSWALICPLLPKKGGIFRETPKGEKILHSKPLICHDRVSSVKWQIDNLSVRDMASLELANKGSRGEYSLVSAIQIRAKFQKHKICPRNGYLTDCCLRSTIQMAQMFLFKPLPQSTKS